MSVLLQAHIAGLPVEEMLLAFSPVGGFLGGWLVIRWRDRLKDHSPGGKSRQRRTPMS